MTIARILVIAGSDSSGGAGIQADIRTITMLGAHPMTAITAVTAQNTQGVQGVHMLPADFVVTQAQSCIADIGVDAVKIGMLGAPEIAHAVADLLETLSVPIVFDPVMVATSGAVLADAETIAGFERLMALAALTTPNLPELEALGGEAVLREKTRALLIKGGHAAGPHIENRLVESGGETVFVSPRIDTRHTHGTGCTLASGIAAGLGAGMDLRAATGRAIRFVEQAIAHVPGLGHGGGPLGHAMGGVPFDATRPIGDQGLAGGS